LEFWSICSKSTAVYGQEAKVGIFRKTCCRRSWLWWLVCVVSECCCCCLLLFEIVRGLLVCIGLKHADVTDSKVLSRFDNDVKKFEVVNS
jgi:hypothetical protein